MQNKTISFEAAEAAVMQTWKSLLKQTNPYLVPILLPMIEHFKPLFQEFYDLGVSHGRTAQAVPEGFVLVPLDVVERCMSHICLAMCHQNNSNSENDVMQMDLEILESALEAQEPAND